MSTEPFLVANNMPVLGLADDFQVLFRMKGSHNDKDREQIKPSVVSFDLGPATTFGCLCVPLFVSLSLSPSLVAGLSGYTVNDPTIYPKTLFCFLKTLYQPELEENLENDALLATDTGAAPQRACSLKRTLA